MSEGCFQIHSFSCNLGRNDYGRQYLVIRVKWVCTHLFQRANETSSTRNCRLFGKTCFGETENTINILKIEFRKMNKMFLYGGQLGGNFMKHEDVWKMSHGNCLFLFSSKCFAVYSNSFFSPIKLVRGIPYMSSRDFISHNLDRLLR